MVRLRFVMVLLKARYGSLQVRYGSLKPDPRIWLPGHLSAAEVTAGEEPEPRIQIVKELIRSDTCCQEPRAEL